MALMAGATQYEDIFWWSADGVRLHARDYPGDTSKPPLICMPGLTRNARDFEPLVIGLNGALRMICVELRGRGESGYAKDPMTYVPLTYWQDVERLIAEQGLTRFSLVGTSLGGIVSMMLAAAGEGRIETVILNDIGPVIEADGLARVRALVARTGSWPTWMHAARALADSNRDIYPHFGSVEWLAMAKRLYKLNANGRIVQDYDPRIAEPFRLPGNDTPADLWSTFDHLKTVPTLIVRGGVSDILSAATLDAMCARLDHGQAVTVADVGHVPLLDEPEVLTVIRAMLAA
jgi:pimeloyl-ACP methyl ester carboxylesterase